MFQLATMYTTMVMSRPSSYGLPRQALTTTCLPVSSMMSYTVRVNIDNTCSAALASPERKEIGYVLRPQITISRTLGPVVDSRHGTFDNSSKRALLLVVCVRSAFIRPNARLLRPVCG